MLPIVAVVVLLAAAAGAQGQDALPPGPGKQIVEDSCTVCHSVRRIVSAGYTRAGWRNVIAMMVNAGAELTPREIDTLTDYLATNFPEKSAPSAQVVPGNLRVTIKEWVVPTPGSRPHDPLATADGDIWYTGQMANVLGRFDPRTEKFKEYPLPPDSGPHGLVADKAGHIWFTANFKGYIGELDPTTGNVTQYPLPPDARDPHTPIFAQNGILWFTVQGADMVGWLNPQTREMKVVKVPTPHALPYGMAVNSKGIPFFAEFGANKLASIDPQSMAITEYPLLNPRARPRRIAITSDDVIWYSDYARGYLGRFDPQTGKQTEWPSPGGTQAAPYGITAMGGAIWYSESGVTPNTLVRFDSVAKTFQTWPIPSGGGVVRNMMPTSDGNLVLACSGVNRIALVEVRK